LGYSPSLLVNGAATFPMDTSPHRDTFPQVSTPWRRLASTTPVRSSPRETPMRWRTTPVRAAWTQYRPSVDSDGWRFGVAYHGDFYRLIFNREFGLARVEKCVGGSFTILAEDRSEFGGGGTLRPERSGVGSTSFRDRRSLRNAGGGGTATGSPPRAVTARR
jgi:hypothetical protein